MGGSPASGDLTPSAGEPEPRPPARREGEAGAAWREEIPGFEFGRPRRDIWNPPVFGASAVLLGGAALFRAPLLLGPIAVLFGLIALIRGQYALGAIGTITGAAAILTSPWFWTGIGIAWFYEKLL
jgi:hypothetical protein